MISSNLFEPLIGKGNSRELLILKLLCKEQFLSWEKIQTKIELSIRNIKKIILNLNDHIREHNLIIKVCYGKEGIYIPNNPDKIVITNSFEELKHQFFKNSIFYKAARIITDSKYCKICELSNKLNYSISYCYKLISTINNLFDDISLEIQFNIKKNTIYIEGELTDIILFRYFLYIISAENFNTISEQNISKYVNSENLSNTSYYKLKLLISIYYDSFMKYDNSIHLPEDVKEISNNFKPSIFSPSQYMTTFDEIQNDVLYFLLLYAIPTIVNDYNKIKIARNLDKNFRDNKIVQNVSKVLDRIYEFRKYDENQYFITFYEILVKVIISLIFRVYRFDSKLRDSDFPINEFNDTLSYILNTKIGHYFNGEEWEFLRKYLLHVIRPEVPLLVKRTLKVYIEFHINTLYIEILKNAISEIYNKNFLTFTENILESDLIISDYSPSYFGVSAKVLLITDIYDNESWIKLSENIQKSYMEFISSV